MKRILYFTAFILLISSCAVNKKPIFIKVDNIKVLKASASSVTLSADALFKNPNTIGGKISTDAIKVIINGAEVATVSSKEFKVPARKEFAIPLIVEIPTKRIFENNKNGIISGLLNSILNKSIKIQFKGALRYKVLGFSKVYLIDKTQEVKL